MTMRTSVPAVIWGILSMLAGALMTQGGVMEAVSYWGQGPTWIVALGALGALGSIVMLVSGVAFCMRRAFGRNTAIAGAIAMIPVHFAGWMFGLVGISGAIVGVAYPTLLLIVLSVRPNLGLPVHTNSGSVPQQQLPPPSNLARRAALDVA